MLNIGSSRFQTENLFFQPTWTCGKNCPTCYVKEKENIFKPTQIGSDLWTRIFNEVFVKRASVDTEQTTLALDTLPSHNHIKYTNEDRQAMIRIARSYLTYSSQGKDIEAHLTINCINDLKEYLFELQMDTLPDSISLLSVSNINTRQDVEVIKKLAPYSKVNWNVLSTSLVKHSLENIKSILQVIDNMYLLLNKAPLGYPGHEIQSFIEAVGKVAALKDNTPAISGACKVPDLTSKIVTDHCMSDAVNSLKTGQGCKANISRFQIWPDGRVTGCAYNSRTQYDKAAITLDDVVSNLRAAKQRYEFKSCNIPSELVKLNKNRKLKQTE